MNLGERRAIKRTSHGVSKWSAESLINGSRDKCPGTNQRSRLDELKAKPIHQWRLAPPWPVGIFRPPVKLAGVHRPGFAFPQEPRSLKGRQRKEYLSLASGQSHRYSGGNGFEERAGKSIRHPPRALALRPTENTPHLAVLTTSLNVAPRSRIDCPLSRRSSRD